MAEYEQGTKMLHWLGLRGTHDTDEIPLWAGVPKRAKWISFGLWLVIAAMIFILVRFRLPADDGFGGFLPVFSALLVFIAGSSVTERHMLKTQK